jgi:hypothetical protein
VHFFFAALARVVADWGRLYDNSKVLEATVTATHIGGLLAGGGLAIAADRLTLRAARRAPEDRDRHLAELGTVHRPVLIGLAVVCASGVLMFAADWRTLGASPVFWIKLGLIGLLLANGGLMVRTEAALRRGVAANEAVVPGQWRRLVRAARVSLVLWFAVLASGSLLTLV